MLASLKLLHFLTPDQKHIFASIKKSLERLQLDYVDVLQCRF
jgi:aryl-alcohol dehydrogenase-like predicted oxidoreductase